MAGRKAERKESQNNMRKNTKSLLNIVHKIGLLKNTKLSGSQWLGRRSLASGLSQIYA